MPGFLVPPINGASGVVNIPSGNISATNIQDAINELDSEKTTESYVNAQISPVDQKATSAKTIAMLGL